MSALPILLLGGAALLMMGGKKKSSGSTTKPKEAVTTRLGGIKKPTYVKFQKSEQKAPTLVKFQKSKELSDASTQVELAAKKLCLITPNSAREEQARIYVRIAIGRMRGFHGGLGGGAYFPCSDGRRLSWVVDEAFRLWIEGNPNVTTNVKKIEKNFWFKLTWQDARMSLTAVSHDGLRVLSNRNLNECASHIIKLITDTVRKECYG